MSVGMKGEPGSLSEPGSHQAIAVLGIALIAMGEGIGAEMAHRIYSQLVSPHTLTHHTLTPSLVALWGASDQTSGAASSSSPLDLSPSTLNHRHSPQVLSRQRPHRRQVNTIIAMVTTLNNNAPIIRNAIFSMGLVGCGTNNARLAGMLRNLAQFYHKEPSDLFMVRLAQVCASPSLSPIPIWCHHHLVTTGADPSGKGDTDSQSISL